MPYNKNVSGKKSNNYQNTDHEKKSNHCRAWSFCSISCLTSVFATPITYLFIWSLVPRKGQDINGPLHAASYITFRCRIYPFSRSGCSIISLSLSFSLFSFYPPIIASNLFHPFSFLHSFEDKDLKLWVSLGSKN